MRLRLESRLVEEDSGVGVETGESEADVVVDETNLGGSNAGVLELHGGALLAAEDHHVGTLDTNSAGTYSRGRRNAVSYGGRRTWGVFGLRWRVHTSLYRLSGIFDLEDVAIGTIGTLGSYYRATVVAVY